jgi:hypothetical protein
MATYIQRKRNNSLLGGMGSSSAPYTFSAANKNVLGYWAKSNATSGDARVLYARLYLNAAGGGEAIRAFATATASGVAAGGTMNGIHATAYVNSGGTISGQASAGRFTFGAAAGAGTIGGTLSSLILDTDIGATVTVPASHAFIRVANLGTGVFGNLFQVPTASTSGGTTGIFCNHPYSTVNVITHSIKFVDAAGTAYYIMCTTASSGRGA